MRPSGASTLAGTYTEATPDAGVTPDVEVRATVDTLRAGRDMDREMVDRLIGSKR